MVGLPFCKRERDVSLSRDACGQNRMIAHYTTNRPEWRINAAERPGIW